MRTKICFLTIGILVFSGLLPSAALLAADRAYAENYQDALNHKSLTQKQKAQRAQEEMVRRSAQAQSQGQSQAQKEAMQQYFIQLQNNPPAGVANKENTTGEGAGSSSIKYLNRHQGKADIKQNWQSLSHDGRVQYCTEMRNGCLKDRIELVCSFFYENCQRKY